MMRYDELSPQEQLLVRRFEDAYIKYASVERPQFVRALAFTLNKYKFKRLHK